ncbi:MAG: LemA family protein, partial [Planctomycetota bacterium]
GLIVAFILLTYNRLALMRNEAQNSLSQIGIQLRRRHELIPDLVAVVRRFMGHEHETLRLVISARNTAASCIEHAQPGAGSKGALSKLAAAETSLTQSLGRLQIVLEDYPELKTDLQVANLTTEIRSTENRIAFARQNYNDRATDFNTARTTFPAIMIARMIGFESDFSLLEFKDQHMIRRAPVLQLA